MSYHNNCNGVVDITAISLLLERYLYRTKNPKRRKVPFPSKTMHLLSMSARPSNAAVLNSSVSTPFSIFDVTRGL